MASGPPRFGPNGREMLLTLNVATWGIMCWGAGLRLAVPVLWTYLQTVGINFLKIWLKGGYIPAIRRYVNKVREKGTCGMKKT